MGHRPTFPAGSLGNETGHRVSRPPRLPPRQPRGYLGQGRPPGTEPPPKHTGLGRCPLPSKGRPGPGRGFVPVAHPGDGVAKSILTPAPWGSGTWARPGGCLHQGLCRDLPVSPKTPSPPPRESSPLSWGHPAPSGQFRGGAAPKIICGVAACPGAEWGAEGFGVIPPHRQENIAKGRGGEEEVGATCGPCATERGVQTPMARSCGICLVLGCKRDARPRGGGDREEGVAGAGGRTSLALGRAAQALPKPPEVPAPIGPSGAGLEGTHVGPGGDSGPVSWGTRREGPASPTESCGLGRQTGVPGAGARYRPKIPPRQVRVQLWRRPWEGLTAVAFHRQRKVCQWDRMAPATGPRAATGRGATTAGMAEPRGWTVPRCRLHKGQRVAAGRELGKKYLCWEESKYRSWDILIAGWRLLFNF